MCATCVASGAVYVGGALGALRLMAARAEARRRGDDADRSRREPVRQAVPPSATTITPTAT